MIKPIIIKSTKEDLGGFFVHRALPKTEMHAVGPFVFMDHMGPMKITHEQAISVRPHPHIGLATVTYLFEGRCTHRDSLGNVQVITPGDLNWMTAGKGIVHSERTPMEDRDPQLKNKAHGIQIWVGLPTEVEECEPSFSHWDKEAFPSHRVSPGLTAKVLLGEFGGIKSPATTLSRTLFMDFQNDQDLEASLPFSEKELGIFLVSGCAVINGITVEENDLAVFRDATSISFKISAGTRLIVIGGDPFPERRHMWWNFVATKKDLIERASEKWLNQTLGKVPGETEYAPLPTDEDA